MLILTWQIIKFVPLCSVIVTVESMITLRINRIIKYFVTLWINIMKN